MSVGAQEYRKWESAPMAVFDCEVWYRAERTTTAAATSGELSFEPMFIYTPGWGVGIYYREDDEQQDERRWRPYFEARPERFWVEVQRYRRVCAQIPVVAEGARTAADFVQLAGLIEQMWLMLATAFHVGDEAEQHPSDITWAAYQLRLDTEQLSYVAKRAMRRVASTVVPPQFVAHVDFLTFGEVVTGAMPSPSALAARMRGYVYYRGALHTPENLQWFFRKRGIRLTGATAVLLREIRGAVACPGVVRGMVQRLLDHRDFTKDFTGSVLVASMTTPDFMPQMRAAAGLITDLGGITCHAAIVARELKKPCIIGTEIATQVLKDGDLVEVDADHGVVRVL